MVRVALFLVSGLVLSLPPVFGQVPEADVWSYSCADYDQDGYGSKDDCTFLSRNSARVFSKSAFELSPRGRVAFVRNSDDCNDFTALLNTHCPTAASYDIGYFQGLVYLLETYPYDITTRVLEQYRNDYNRLYARGIVPQLARISHAK